MKNVIVTGANGFLGRSLVKKLTEKNIFVTAVDVNFDEDSARNTLVKCVDCRNKSMDELENELKGEYDCLFHLAWQATSGNGRADYRIQLCNVMLTCDYVCLSSSIGCKRFIYASSINEMETYEYMQSDNIKPSPGYIYGTGKLAAHLMGETVAYQHDIEFIPVLITNIYGAGENSARLINTSIRKLLRNEHCSFTDGYQTYDFIYITDAVQSIIEIADKGKAYNRYYVGSGTPRPLRDFLLEMKAVVNDSAELGLGDIAYNGAQISYDQFELDKVEKDTGYSNKIPFEEGIRLTTEWIKSESE